MALVSGIRILHPYHIGVNAGRKIVGVDLPVLLSCSYDVYLKVIGSLELVQTDQGDRHKSEGTRPVTFWQ
jgi:hypothetical protein